MKAPRAPDGTLLCKRCVKAPRFLTNTLCLECLTKYWSEIQQRKAKKSRNKFKSRVDIEAKQKKKKAKKARQAELAAKAKEFLATLTPEQQDELAKTGDPGIAKPSDLPVRERTIHL